ncbi:MAG: P-loop NTPase [Caldilineaceae bacterium]|nr:P-loop NTPase [Caldilineaceae bacterium]
MTLKTYLTILWRRKWVIGLTVALTVAVAIGGSQLLDPVYESSTKLQVATATGGSLSNLDYDLNYSDRLMNTYTHVAQSGPVIQALMERFSLEKPPKFDVRILTNTELIEIKTEANSPELAYQLVTALAEQLMEIDAQRARADIQDKQEVLVQQMGQLERELADLQDGRTPSGAAGLGNSLFNVDEEIAVKRAAYADLYQQYRDLATREVIQYRRLTVMDPATIPLKPEFPNYPIFWVAGVMLGLVAGLGLAFLFENMDTTLHSVEQIEDVTQLAPLAAIPQARRIQWPAIIMNSHSAQEEAFARLYATLSPRIQEAHSHVILVTSAQPGEGKSTVVANLGAAMAKAGHNVLAVDCNAYNPSLHEIFQLPNKIGLVNILHARGDLSKAVQVTLAPNLRAVTLGEWEGHPAELWAPTRLAHLAQELGARRGITLLDAPAYLAANDALLLSSIADSIVLVVGQSVAHEESVRLAHQSLGNTNKLAGIVVNRATQHNAYQYDWN